MKFLKLVQILSFFILFVFGSSGVVWGQVWDGPRIYQTYQDSIVFITVTVELSDGGKKEWTGTGFIVNEKPGFVLTNSHVVKDPQNYKSYKILGTIGGRGTDKPRFELQLIKREPQLDMALLHLPDRRAQWKATQIGNSNDVTIAENLFVLGFPKQRALTFVAGSLSNTNAENGRFQTSTPLNPGTSGAPVFNNRGDVVAVVVGGDPNAQNLNFLIPINYARGLLRLVGPPW